jgi:hypothetical protein
MSDDIPCGVSMQVSPEYAKLAGLKEHTETYVETLQFIDGGWVKIDTRRIS